MPPRKIKHNPLLLREKERLADVVATELAEYQAVHGVNHLHFRINKKDRKKFWKNKNRTKQ